MKDLLKIFTGKRLFFCSSGVAGFFGLVVLDWCLPDSDWALIVKEVIEFLGNMLMLPILFCFYPGLLILSIIHCIREKFRIKSWSFGSFFILLVSNPFCVESIIDAWSH